MSVQWSGVVFGLLFLVAGVGVAGFTVYGEYQDQQIADNAASVTGSVVGTDMESATEVDDGETEVEYYPRVDYEYTVDGTAYKGWRIYATTDLDKEAGELPGRDFDSRSAARNVLGQFQGQDTVTVYYDPADPSVAFLIPPRFDLLTALGGGAFGAIFSFAGIATAIKAFRGNLDSD
ncbi:DUF3592 domain-containing protein [Haloarchaeobius sp. HME9146]|uniref:DUF3592 domain-containing protein n=1 Tax=Haloarchaeobius sp. HME9146 TaxID=2978732 RepID=UPI0021C0DAA1|nr:DUF3592 domain-containing protein [Haloarchaeobius sp. HME9146]MCT9098250.1 DUF3592 domain-containing protein [Haloarchaeobius sp. HME9146]